MFNTFTLINRFVNTPNSDFLEFQYEILGSNNLLEKVGKIFLK